MENAIENIRSRIDQIEERINETENRKFETLQTEEKKEKKEWERIKKAYVIYETALKKNNIWITGVSEGEEREKGTESTFIEYVLIFMCFIVFI